MSVQFAMSSAPRNGSRTRYRTKLHLNFSTESITPGVPPTPAVSSNNGMDIDIGIGNKKFLLKAPSVLQMPLHSPNVPPISLNNPNLLTEPAISSHWTNVEKLNNELFRLFYFRSSNPEESELPPSSVSIRSHPIVKIETEIEKKVKQQKIQKLKLREPVQKSNWLFDYFEEADIHEKQQKKEKIQKLKLREPVKQSCWISSPDKSDSDSMVDDYYI